VLCTQRELVAGDLVAIEGSKCTAVHAKERNCTRATLTQLHAQLEQRLAGSRKDLDGQATPEEAGTPGGAVADQVRAQREALPHRQLRSADVPAQ
jgi:hypothetical protein